MRRLGRYEILGEVATGGMAEILLGRLSGPSGFERVVVVKRILPHLSRRAEFVEMFLDEARTVARLRHANVVQVHELAEADGELYLVMEYLEGESLAGLLRRLIANRERLDPWLAAHVVAEACRGLHAAHELTNDDVPLDLVHRDVSPQNLFVTYAGGVKVIDFGIAKAADRTARTEAGQVKGKFAYMSPEQCAGKAVDRRSDVFALGIVLWEAMTATQLFKRASELATLKAICELPIPRPSSVESSIPASLEAVAMRALERRRDDRYASAAAMRKDLLAAAVELGRGRDAEEELAALMRRLFADRIEEKADLVRRARSTGDVASVPTGECDLTVDMPAMEDAVDATSTTHTLPATPAPRRWVAWAGAGAAVVVLGAAGWTGWRGMSGTEPPTPSAPARNDGAPAASAAASEAPPVASTVVLHVESTPAGANVRAGVRELGKTPLDATFARDGEPLELSFELAGHQPARMRVVPTADQRLATTLQPLPQQRPPRPVVTAAPRATSAGIEKLP